MIARKIEKAAQTLGNIKIHVEPAVWKMMCQAINTLLEAAAEVRVLEKKSRMANVPAVDGFIVPDADGALKIDPARLGDHLEGIAVALRESGRAPDQSAARRCASDAQSGSGAALSIIPAPEVN